VDFRAATAEEVNSILVIIIPQASRFHSLKIGNSLTAIVAKKAANLEASF